LLAGFFVLPVLRLLVLSVQDQGHHGLTLTHFQQVFQNAVYTRVLLVTFRISILTALISVLLGYPLAYWIVRLPSSRRTVAMFLVMVPFWTSYLVKTFAWLLILGRTGVINQLVKDAGGPQFSLLYNQSAVLVGMVHGMLPLAVLTLIPVLGSIDRRLVQAAETLGAHPTQAFWLVYFQLSLPGIASAGLLTFLTALGFFIVPALLGGPGQTLMAQLIITQIQQSLDWGFAGALSAFLLAATALACWFYDRVFGMSTLSGEGQAGAVRSGAGGAARAGRAALSACAAANVALGAVVSRILPKRVVRALLPGYGVLAIIFLVAPTLIVVPIAFTSSTFLDFPPPGYSLRWFQTYFNSPLWIEATVRSFAVGFVTAACATVIGGAAALAIARSNTRWRGAIFALFLAPMIVPRIILAVGLMYLFSQMGLIGTNLGLVIGHTVLALPFTFITMAAVLKGYDQRLDHAAAVLGANRWRTVQLITIPLLKGGLVAAFLFAFVTSFDELTVALFVTGGINTTLPKQMWDDMFLQLSPTIAAVSVVVFAIVTTLLLLCERFRDKGEQVRST
jgi:ABC-type spermidine/putrescine transport system permease subunit II